MGVRLVWVSAPARRRRHATRLLDLVRCHLVPGYVVPRSLVGFSQPTEDGVALARSYCGSDSFLVYGG